MEDFIVALEKERITELEAQRDNELKAYLLAAELKDYSLSDKEKTALEQLESNKIKWGEVTFNSIFNEIHQGRRLKKQDQIIGNIPFVMAGVTNTGIANYVSNPVASFPPNSITIDILGNVFYRNYAFGAGDDTGVYWSSQNNYSKKLMLFFATIMGKSLVGRFSFAKKLRSSKSLNFKVKLPIINNSPNFQLMETIILAAQKLVIQDVINSANRKIEVTKKIVNMQVTE